MLPFPFFPSHIMHPSWSYFEWVWKYTHNLRWTYFNPTLGNDVPKEVTLKHCEDALLGIQEYLVLPTSLKYFVNMAWVVWLLSREDCHVIEVDHYALSDEPMESDVHCTLKCSSFIYQHKWNSLVSEHTPLGMKCCLQSIGLYYKNLIVSCEII